MTITAEKKKSLIVCRFMAENEEQKAFVRAIKKRLESVNETIDATMNPCHLKAISMAVDKYQQMNTTGQEQLLNTDETLIQDAVKNSHRNEEVQVQHCHAEDLLNWNSLQRGNCLQKKFFSTLLRLFILYISFSVILNNKF